MGREGSTESLLGQRSNQPDIKVRVGRSAIRPRELWPLGHLNQRRKDGSLIGG